MMVFRMQLTFDSLQWRQGRRSRNAEKLRVTHSR